jgi:hypothetical protein
MGVSGRLLPHRVDLRLTAVFDYLGEARCFDLEKFHCDLLYRRGRGDAVYQKKPARELRQGGSYYRCCIPALAGFVSPQSIVPDGAEISSHQRDVQLENAAPGRVPCRARVGKRISALTVRFASVCFERVKCVAFLLLVSAFVAATSCTTLVNRRDLYSPEPAPDSLEAARQWYGVTTISTRTTIRTQSAAGEIAPPDFRY